MTNHQEEEDTVKVVHRRKETRGKAPRNGHAQVGGILDFPRKCVPAIDEQVAFRRPDKGNWLLQHTPREGRKAVAAIQVGIGAARPRDLHGGLLLVRGIEGVVCHEKEGEEEQREDR